jgi:hypothetical protein
MEGRESLKTNVKVQRRMSYNQEQLKPTLLDKSNLVTRSLYCASEQSCLRNYTTKVRSDLNFCTPHTLDLARVQGPRGL